MNLNLCNISRGYAEVWMNGRPGERYRHIGSIVRDSADGRWAYCVHRGYETVLPFCRPSGYGTRRECWRELRRAAYTRQAERAIAEQTEESPHWHSPRRDAYNDMFESGVFSVSELRGMRRRIKQFGEGAGE